jgi:hypothetical protein
VTDPGLISVRADVAASLLIDGLYDAAASRLGEELGAETSRVLDELPDPRAASLGYLARAVELDRFEVARAPVPWLAQRLRDATPEALSAELAAEEPLGKPSPADAAPSWRIPGPGGHVRHFLALQAVGDGPEEHKRSWYAGFFLRCCEDASVG